MNMIYAKAQFRISAFPRNKYNLWEIKTRSSKEFSSVRWLMRTLDLEILTTMLVCVTGERGKAMKQRKKLVWEEEPVFHSQLLDHALASNEWFELKHSKPFKRTVTTAILLPKD